jgi:phosphatidate cytidylyltransferase
MTRVLSGAVLLLVAIVIVWFAPAPLFFWVAEAVLLLAAGEYVLLARGVGIAVPPVAGAIAAALACATFTGTLPRPAALDVILMTAFVALAATTVAGWRDGANGLASASASLFPVLYLGLPIGAMVAIREARGPAALFLLMITVIASDTAQYYSGRSFGRRKLAPAISPKKTVEGALGGFVAGAVVMAVAGAWWLPAVPAAMLALLGVAVVALGIAGDLFESMLKRSAGVKDSSSLIPGHGGILDRIDALLFAAPVYYVVLRYI